MTYADIQTRFYLLTKTNSNFTAANLNSYITPASDHVIALINKNDARWQFDDSNYSDLPIATAALVSGQQDYSLATTHLTIDRVELKDSSGNWRELTQIDQQDKKRGNQIALGTYQNVNGVPLEYDVVGNSVFLYPAPNFSQAASLKLYFTRGQLNFDYSTSKFTDGTGSTTSSPGFNSLFHDLIPLWAAYDYAVVNLPALAAGYFNAIQIKEQSLVDFYGNRDRDRRPHIGTPYEGAASGSQSGYLGTWQGDSNR